METIGSIIRAIKNLRREININSRRSTDGNQELFDKYRQEVELAAELRKQADRLDTYAAVLMGMAKASQETVLGWIQNEQTTTAEAQLDLPF